MAPIEDRVWDWFARSRTLRHWQIVLLVAATALATWGLQRVPHLVHTGEPMTCFAVDGRTLECGGQDIRLHGIDVPALNAFAGMVARVQLDSLVVGREVFCETVSKGGGGQLLGRCRIDGRDVGELMVRAGVALDCPAESGGRYGEFERSRAHATMERAAACR